MNPRYRKLIMERISGKSQKEEMGDGPGGGARMDRSVGLAR